jgi:uncharacterized protein YkwD
VKPSHLVYALLTAVELGIALGGVAAHEAARTASAVPASPRSAGMDAVEREILALVNQVRAREGRAPLLACRALAKAARKHSADMRDRDAVGHESRGGASARERMCAAGFEPACRFSVATAETIAAGRSAPKSVLADWLESPRHRSILLDPAFRRAGVGRASGGSYGHYWTVNLAAADDPSC